MINYILNNIIGICFIAVAIVGILALIFNFVANLALIGTVTEIEESIDDIYLEIDSLSNDVEKIESTTDYNAKANNNNTEIHGKRIEDLKLAVNELQSKIIKPTKSTKKSSNKKA